MISCIVATLFHVGFSQMCSDSAVNGIGNARRCSGRQANRGEGAIDTEDTEDMSQEWTHRTR